MSCGTCCMGFSLFSALFLLVVGEVIRSGSDVIPLEDESQRGHAADTCFYAAIFYICCIVVSYFSSVVRKWNEETPESRALMNNRMASDH